MTMLGLNGQLRNTTESNNNSDQDHSVSHTCSGSLSPNDSGNKILKPQSYFTSYNYFYRASETHGAKFLGHPPIIGPETLAPRILITSYPCTRAYMFIVENSYVIIIYNREPLLLKKTHENKL